MIQHVDVNYVDRAHLDSQDWPDNVSDTKRSASAYCNGTSQRGLSSCNTLVKNTHFNNNTLNE